MNPIEMIYCWQALIIAVVASGMTEAVKRTIDVLRGIQLDGDGHVSIWEAMGQELRRDSIVINNLVLPCLAVFCGALAAAVLPIRPEVIIAYTNEHATGWQAYTVFAGWGAVCGAFSSLTFRLLKDSVNKMAKSPTNNEG